MALITSGDGALKTWIRNRCSSRIRAFCLLCPKEGIKVPIAVLGAEIDETAPPELLKQFEEALATKSELDRFMKVFPKTAHEWTVRYKDEDKAAAKESHLDMKQWFVKYVK
ncbi:hypothetical protein EUGRSUZ_B01153 [Eucalyptus grandis]|uniref:Uncharacterized protein n=2 Tax=Eucalyptus grandis TaxID=71139 RepID=A0ACC3LPD2_EUCGR|nr:hypothetical protein EUGRSUZ_B01153 [Eucalyptus grandis]